LIRVAAVGDIHYSVEEPGLLTPHLRRLSESADLLLMAGDLTRYGAPAEAAVLADDLAQLAMPKVAVLGNHDYHQDRETEVAEMLYEAGVEILQGTSVVIDVDGARLGIAGAKGFGGGFAGASITAFGEPEIKAFANHSIMAAEELATALEQLRSADVGLRVALLHYSPVEQTLVGEPAPLWPFLGNYLLAEAIDRVGADLVVHGHAHSGSREGTTPNGVPVLNVAHSVIGKPFELVQLGA
jgi:Icc-related predicted phosphoesterase